MSPRLIPVVGVMLLAGALTTATTVLRAQARSNDANISMMDNCSERDPAWNGFGGCPQGAPFPGFQSYRGDVNLAEFFALLSSPLAPGDLIGHPSWRMEPSYVSLRTGRTVRVTNDGGRGHTFTEVANFGGGFVPLLNAEMVPAPECVSTSPAPVVVAVGQTQSLTVNPGLHKFQCCIHPWMRAAIRTE